MDWVLLAVMAVGLVASLVLRHGPRQAPANRPLGADDPIPFHTDSGFGAICPVPRCGFVSRGWSTPTLAQSRLEQHLLEHRTGQLMPELPTETTSHVGRI